MNDTTGDDTRSTDTIAARLIELWLAEAEEHAAGPEGSAPERGAAAQARRAWEDGGRFTGEAARELADWATARVTDTGFTEEENASPKPGTRISVSEKEAVHRWLAEQEYRV